MRGADEVAAVAVEEVVGAQVERGVAVRAAVAIGENLIAAAQHDHAQRAALGIRYDETLRAAVGNLLEAAGRALEQDLQASLAARASDRAPRARADTCRA